MNYVERVADLFLKHSGNGLLSATDYVMIAEWEKEEIPIEIVLSSINRFFTNLPTGKGSFKIESIEYFHAEIENVFAKSL